MNDYDEISWRDILSALVVCAVVWGFGVLAALIVKRWVFFCP